MASNERKEVMVVVWDTYHHLGGVIWYTWLVHSISDDVIPADCRSVANFVSDVFVCRVVCRNRLWVYLKDGQIAREIAEKHRDSYVYWKSRFNRDD